MNGSFRQVDGWMENKPKQQVKDEHREQRQPLRQALVRTGRSWRLDKL